VVAVAILPACFFEQLDAQLGVVRVAPRLCRRERMIGRQESAGDDRLVQGDIRLDVLAVHTVGDRLAHSHISEEILTVFIRVVNIIVSCRFNTEVQPLPFWTHAKVSFELSLSFQFTHAQDL